MPTTLFAFRPPAQAFATATKPGHAQVRRGSSTLPSRQRASRHRPLLIGVAGPGTIPPGRDPYLPGAIASQA